MKIKDVYDIQYLFEVASFPDGEDVGEALVELNKKCREFNVELPKPYQVDLED